MGFAATTSEVYQSFCPYQWLVISYTLQVKSRKRYVTSTGTQTNKRTRNRFRFFNFPIYFPLTQKPLKYHVISSGRTARIGNEDRRNLYTSLLEHNLVGSSPRNKTLNLHHCSETGFIHHRSTTWVSNLPWRKVSLN